MFLSFDGVDGAGKSTQIERCTSWLREIGHDVVACRDPGTTPLGERVRSLLLDRAGFDICRMSEMLLYMASRAQLVEAIIRPALDAGKTVVSDRYLLASVVYQGHAGGVDIEAIRDVGRLVTRGLEPDLSIVFDLSPELAASRRNRPADRMESQGAAFDAAVRAGYRSEAARSDGRVVIVDASGSIAEVAAEVRRHVQSLFHSRGERQAPSP